MADTTNSNHKLGGFDFWKNTLQMSRFVVAPMVDQSELAWRMLSRKYGAELCYTPMLHASVFVRDANYRKEALESCDGDRPLIVQFCANDPDIFLQAAEIAQDHCDAVDLNLGCPQVIAKRGHYGAFLQDEWDLLHRMVSVCHRKLKVPITCKIRVFSDVEKTVKYAKMLQNAGCQLLTVHGRTKEQKGALTGIADWNAIKAVKDNLSIPVFSNGNIQYLPDVERCLKETGVEGVMTAEGNLHNPALFKGINPPVWQMAREYIEMVKKYPCPMSYVRGHVFKMSLHLLTVHKDLREDVAKAKNVAEMLEVVGRMEEKCKEDVQKYEKDPSSLKIDLPLPYWLCQPYVRPSPEEAQEKQQKISQQQKETAAKRPLENNEDDPNYISKNKLKKKMRYPNKTFNQKITYEICAGCPNPKGTKCHFNLCKSCCKIKMCEETLDCPGHKILIKTKRELRLQKENPANTEVEDANNPMGHQQTVESGNVTEKDKDEKTESILQSTDSEEVLKKGELDIAENTLTIA